MRVYESGFIIYHMEKISQIFQKFQKDYLRVLLAVTNLLLAASMIVSPEPRDLFFWITLGFRLITVPIAVFIGNKGLWVCYFLFCNVGVLQIQYKDFSYAALLMVLFSLTPKVSKSQAFFVAGLYATDIFIVAGMHDKGSYYIWNHFILTAQYCAAMWKQKVICNHDAKVMILTPDEIEILKKLESGYSKKQIEGYSEASIYRKLTEARERNSCTNNDELLKLYKKSFV